MRKEKSTSSYNGLTDMVLWFGASGKKILAFLTDRILPFSGEFGG